MKICEDSILQLEKIEEALAPHTSSSTDFQEKLKLFHVEWEGAKPTPEDISKYSEDEKLEILLKIVKAGWFREFHIHSIQFGIDINKLGKAGWNCLHFATYYGYVNIVQHLLIKLYTY